MNTIEAITTRRSVRKFKDEVVDRKVLEEIVEAARWAPSWTNVQVARYTFVDKPESIAKIASDGVKGFGYNMKTLENAKGVLVLSHVVGKSGIMPEKYGVPQSENYHVWEHFDTGIACQTFCLAAHEKGVSTCIFGVINEKAIAEIVNLPEDETVSAVIVYGYAEDLSSVKAPPRHEAKDIMRFAD